MMSDQTRLSEFNGAMEIAIGEIRQWPDKTVWIFHHNDADGLCSGAILSRAFERQGFKVQRFCLEKPYPAVLKKIYEQEGIILIFADFAGRIAPTLAELNRGRNLILILDHHAAEASSDPWVHNLDPDLYGFKGDRDISASTTCYLFAAAMDAVNRDMAHIAALGAVGDGFFVDGKLVSLNREVALEAVDQGLVEIKPHPGGEQVLISGFDSQVSCVDLGEYLDILGGVGYFQKGPDMGIRVCLEGISPESDQMLKELQEIQAKAFSAEVVNLQAGGLKNTDHIQWFHVGKRFMPMGVKIIGIFCEFLKVSPYIDPGKYIAGFQNIPDEIPGFGDISFNEVKISMRASPYLEEEIRAGRKMGLNTFLPEATTRLGGFSDACHSLTAATVVAVGQEEKLIAEMEKILNGGLNG